jgi:NAD(P)-dependent dehydrogenase (short-subunit alcohol dehydrogenase family)
MLAPQSHRAAAQTDLLADLPSHHDRGIRVNAVAPGPVWTPLNPADKQAEQVAKFGSGTAMKRAAQPEEIAPAFAFMAAPGCASCITGGVLPIVGGYSG